MIRVEKYRIQDILTNFPEIYCSVFNEFTYQGNCPSEVYIVHDGDKYIGFVSGYVQNTNTWYLQRGGLVEFERKKYLNLYRLKTVLDRIHNDWNFIMTLIKNDDFSTLKISLASKFKIIGTRMDTSGNLWVELIHSNNGGEKK